MSSTEPSARRAWSVSVAKSAQKQLDKLPAADFTRVDAAIESMRVDPFTGDVVQLKKAEAAFRRRVGDSASSSTCSGHVATSMSWPSSVEPRRRTGSDARRGRTNDQITLDEIERIVI